ncbi:hypothetical protein BH09ACT7_BH09ACT7_54440 [soil metagenome]
MSDPLHDRSVVDLDRVVSPKAARGAAPRRRPRRQCPYCFTNRSSILHEELKGCEDRALQALRRAHPEEYDDYLQRERDAAESATAERWEQHMANQCRRTRAHGHHS